MNRNRSIKNLTIVLVCGLFFAVAQAAGAQGSSFSLLPYSAESEETLARLDYSLDAGQSATGAVLVTNLGDEEAELSLLAADARTSTQGGVAFPDSTEPVSAAGAWISLSASQFRLQPQEERVIPFTINVPADAREGEHWAGILLELASLDTSRPADFPEGQIYVAVRFRKALNVRLTVPGPVAVEFEIASAEHVFEGGQSVFQVELRNRGNVPTEMAGGTLEVMDGSGHVIGTLPIKINGKFLAGDTVLYPARFEEPLPEGRYSARVVMAFGGAAPATWQSTFEVTGEAAEEAEQEAIDRGFSLARQPAGEGANYWMFASLGLVALLVGGGLVRLGISMARRRAALRTGNEG